MSGTGSNPPYDPAALGARRASVTLRASQDSADAAALMDPANASLADALRITYRVIQGLMIALAALYVFSGFQTVRETEQGIRVLFGRMRDVGLEPGFRFSYPAPLGELVKVNTGNQTLELYDDFWFYVSEDQKNAKISDLSPTPSLNPERDGSLLTADNNVAHAKVQVIYRRDPAQIGVFAQNIIPHEPPEPGVPKHVAEGGPADMEQAIVRGAVRRAMVQSVAGVTIDELLRQGSDDSGSVAARARDIAQQILDRSKTGLVIDQLKVEEKMPPLNLREKFTNVQTATAAAAGAIEAARQQRSADLNKAAGQAAEVLMRMIDRLELAIAKGDAGARERLMASIIDVLEGRAVEFEGRPVPAGLVTGQVTTILAEARQYKDAVVRQRKADAETFRIKREQYRVSPAFTVYREWADSMTAFMDRDTVQMLVAPMGTDTLQLTINADPEIVRAQDRARKIAEGEAVEKKRAEEHKAAQFKVDTGLKVRGD